MGLRSWLPALLAWAAIALPSGALGQEAAVVETVEGYQIKRSGKPKDPKPCQMVRGYADPGRTNSDKALFFSQLDGRIVVTVAYEPWNWTNGKLPKIRFRVDEQSFVPSTPWYGAETGLGAQFPDAIVPKLNQGKRIVIGIKDGTVDFDLTGFKPAYEAVLRCNGGAGPAPASTPAPDAGSSIADAGKALNAQVEETPAPTPEPVEPSPDTPTPSDTDRPIPGEDRAVAYVLARYEQLALQLCDLRSTAKQRAAIDEKVSSLRSEMQALEPVLADKLAALGAGDCPPSETLERHLAIVAESSPEETVGRMDEKVRREIRGFVRPVLSTAKPLPSESRIAAFLAGLIIEDGLKRCEIATTAKQRAAIAERMAALRPEMKEIESDFADQARKEPCPAEGDPEARQVIALFVEKAPEAFVTEWDGKRGGVMMKAAKELTARLRPPQPAQPRVAAYLYGLSVRDLIAHCDIRTTAKQRVGFEERMASLEPEMRALEPALRERKGPFADCPPPERIAEMESALADFIAQSPEDFAAEMDRRTKAKTSEAAPPSPPAPDATARGDCPLRQSRAHYLSLLQGQVAELSAFTVSDSAPADGGDPDRRIALNGPGHSGAAPDIVILLPDPSDREARFTIESVLRSDQIASTTAAIAATIASLHYTGRTQEVLKREIGNRFSPTSPEGHAWYAQFGGASVSFRKKADNRTTLSVLGIVSLVCKDTP